MLTKERIDELIACAARELALRRNVYGKWVANKKMTQEKADHEIQAMADILDVLQYRKDLIEAGDEMLKKSGQ